MVGGAAYDTPAMNNLKCLKTSLASGATLQVPANSSVSPASLSPACYWPSTGTEWAATAHDVRWPEPRSKTTMPGTHPNASDFQLWCRSPNWWDKMEWPLPVSNRKLVLGGVYFKPDLQRPSQIMNLKTQPADGYTKTSLGFFALCGGGSQRHNKKNSDMVYNLAHPEANSRVRKYLH